MKKAIIDMGSNSIRLLLADIVDGRLAHATKELAMTRLGEGVDATKQLNDRSMRETIEAVEQFKQRAHAEGYELMGAFATSAVREALNGQAFAQRVLEVTGVPVSIISGAQEATLGYLGVLAGLPEEDRNMGFAIVDIGGGSTEVILSQEAKVVWRHSFDMGAVRMTGKHLTHMPVETSEAQGLIADVERMISTYKEALTSVPIERVIGIGGTATTFSAMTLQMGEYNREAIQGAFTSIEALSQWNRDLALMTLAERQAIVGLQPKRADIIYAGGVILEILLKTFGAKGFYSSDFDNLEGLLVDQKIL